MSKKIVNFVEAEKSARKRDLEIYQKHYEEEHNGVDQEAVDEALKVLSKATGGKEVYIGTKKSPQSRVKFVQLIQDNWDYALETNYFTDEGVRQPFLLFGATHKYKAREVMLSYTHFSCF